MLYIGSRVKVIDNSGARLVKCLKILGKSPKSRAQIGDLVVVSIVKAMPNKKVKKGEIYKAVVVRLRFKTYRYGGLYIFSETSSVILLNNKMTVLGTRVLGPVCNELRQKNFLKIISLSPAVV